MDQAIDPERCRAACVPRSGRCGSPSQSTSSLVGRTVTDIFWVLNDQPRKTGDPYVHRYRRSNRRHHCADHPVLTCRPAQIGARIVSTAPEGEPVPAPAPMFSARWWTAEQGWSGIAQWPNPALAVWLIAVVVGWTGALDASRSSTLAGVGNGALLVWALDELVRGESPIRRLLGAVVLAAQLVHLFA
jgi:hypothetical protein